TFTRAEIPPSASPSSTAYAGAVKGAHTGLNTVTRATTNPPSTPASIHGSTVAGAGAALNRAHTQQALTNASNSRTPVLLTVPEIVMAFSPKVVVRPKAPRDRAGLEVRINAMKAG